MNRNVESRFALNPTNIDIPRSQFDRSSGVKFSADIGSVIPFYVDEILPGDTFKVSVSKVVRLQTLVHPIMDNMYMDTYWFFVPNRLVWDHWKNFCGESERAWMPDREYRVPKLNINTTFGHPGIGSLCDYMGIPLNVLTSTEDGNPKAGINALPFRAYAKVMNDWFRPESLEDELDIPTDDADRHVNPKDEDQMFCAYGGPVYRAAKFHDYFTSALPNLQSGPAVKIPVGDGFAPVAGLNMSSLDAFHAADLSTYPLKGYFEDQPSLSRGHYGLNLYYPGSGKEVDMVSSETPITSDASHLFEISNLWADLGFTIGTISELRTAFQVQRFYEKLARGGRRYIEVIKSMFGVTSPDARLQRPEYLGGNRVPINVSEVTNNAQAVDAALGDLGAMSRTTDVHDAFVHSFTEHGILLGLCVIRYPHSYPQGLDRMWWRTTMFDYYWPSFANLSEQAIRRGEINFINNGDGSEFDTFGFQERWAEYRYKPSRVAGEMRPEAPQSLASWHLADYYDQSVEGPFLSSEWIKEDPTNVDRVLAVTSDVANQYFADFYIKAICTRAMPMYSIPGLADHH